MTAGLTGQGALAALSNTLADLAEQTGHSVVAMNGRRRRSASGVHWRSGILVTTEHAVKRDEDVVVTLPDGGTLAATLIGRDAGTDLAVLRLSGTAQDWAALPVATIGDAATLKVGHMVLAIARGDSGISASMGVISSLSGSWRSWHGGRIDQFIRPSLNLYSGFSGSPLVNTDGQIVGINTSGPHHMALTIPASTVNRVVDQLVQGGRVARGYLGVGMQPVQLPDSLKQSLNLANQGGVIILSVESGSPAERAGVLMGDILIALDGNPIRDIGDVHAMLDADRVGSSIPAQLIRGGGLLELTITVGDRPTQEA